MNFLALLRRINASDEAIDINPRRNAWKVVLKRFRSHASLSITYLDLLAKIIQGARNC